MKYSDLKEGDLYEYTDRVLGYRYLMLVAEQKESVTIIFISKFDTCKSWFVRHLNEQTVFNYYHSHRIVSRFATKKVCDKQP